MNIAVFILTLFEYNQFNIIKLNTIQKNIKY